FYLVWPLLLLACRAVKRRRLLMLAAAGVGASALATYVLAGAASPGRVYFGTDTRAQELLAGAILAVLLAPTWQWRAPAPPARWSASAASPTGCTSGTGRSTWSWTASAPACRATGWSRCASRSPGCSPPPRSS